MDLEGEVTAEASEVVTDVAVRFRHLSQLRVCVDRVRFLPELSVAHSPELELAGRARSTLTGMQVDIAADLSMPDVAGVFTHELCHVLAWQNGVRRGWPETSATSEPELSRGEAFARWCDHGPVGHSLLGQSDVLSREEAHVIDRFRDEVWQDDTALAQWVPQLRGIRLLTPSPLGQPPLVGFAENGALVLRGADGELYAADLERRAVTLHEGEVRRPWTNRPPYLRLPWLEWRLNETWHSFRDMSVGRAVVTLPTGRVVELTVSVPDDPDAFPQLLRAIEGESGVQDLMRADGQLVQASVDGDLQTLLVWTWEAE